LFIRSLVANEVIETGERIQLLDAEDRSHIVVPVVHALRANVTEVFAKTLGTDPDNDDVYYLVERQPQPTRPLILNAPTRLRLATGSQMRDASGERRPFFVKYFGRSAPGEPIKIGHSSDGLVWPRGECPLLKRVGPEADMIV
jgi:hypothetical protein